MAVVVIIATMVGLAGPAMMNSFGDARARDLSAQIVNLFNGARARAIGSGRAQLVRFSAAANGGRGGFIAYEGNNTSCNASNWAAIVAAGCGAGTGFCTEVVNPVQREMAGDTLQVTMRTTGDADTWAETDADLCYEPSGITYWRAGAAVAANGLLSSENLGGVGALRGGFLVRVQRLDGSGDAISIDRQLTVPLGAAARSVL